MSVLPVPVESTAICYRPTSILTPKLNHKSISLSRQLPACCCSSMTVYSSSTRSIPRRTLVFRYRSTEAALTSAKGVGAISAMRRGDYVDDSEGQSAVEREDLMASGSLQTASPIFARCTDFEAVLNRLSKWIIAALFGIVILWRHDGEAVWGAMGSVMNAGLCAFLKRVLNQQRPDAATKSDPGMPSSHAQSIFYIITFLVISIVEWLGTDALGLTSGMFVLAFGAYLSWLRVSQKFHTTSQVAVGAIVGSGFSCLWVWSWNGLVSEAYYDLFWVRVLVILASAMSCLSFILYVVGHWLRGDL